VGVEAGHLLPTFREERDEKEKEWGGKRIEERKVSIGLQEPGGGRPKCSLAIWPKKLVMETKVLEIKEGETL